MVILGDMRELGAESLEEHKRIVKQLQEMKLERIWLVGEEFTKAVSDSSNCQIVKSSNCEIVNFNSVDEVKAALKAEPIANSTILIKGSNSTKLHELPDFI